VRAWVRASVAVLRGVGLMVYPGAWVAPAVAAAIVAAAGVWIDGRSGEQGRPLSPADSMASMQLQDGFRIELVASEPDLTSPVAMDIDEHGRLFVVEMPGYPLDTSPSGRVKMLEDTDGDGRYDRVSLFADNLVLPTGVMRWKKGVLVTAAPDLIYFEDADGDGRAERREVLLTGFAFTNPQHTVNHPLYGLDNWIHLAHEGASEAIIYRDLFGDRGSDLRWVDRKGGPTLAPRGRSVRLRPATGELEYRAAASQFGHTFDAWGRYLVGDNWRHARHEVIAARYLARNPHLMLRSAIDEIPEHGGSAQVFAITRRPTFELLTEVGQFTSACGITAYTGGLFPESQGPSLFVAEPVHNLVHRDVLEPAGSTFVARRAEPDREFLAAGDPWFRPVFLYVGPEGALYIVDYYRARIEHPEWAASELQKDPARLSEGRDRGRIYRVVPASWRGAGDERVALGSTSDGRLVAALGHENAWWRRTAQRLIVDRQARTLIPQLTALASFGASPAGRLHALWTLEGLGALDDEVIVRALGDAEAGVRENAVRLAESRLSASRPLAAALAAMEHDVSPRVRFQVLAALGDVDTPAARAAQERMLRAHIDDRWMQAAALSASSGRAIAYLEGAAQPGSPVLSVPSDGRAAFFREAAATIAARAQPSEVTRVLDIVSAGDRAQGNWWRAATLEGLATGTRGRPAAATVLAGARAALVALFESGEASVRRAALAVLRSAGPGTGASWLGALDRAERAARDDGADPALRADSIDLLALDRTRSHEWLRALVSPAQPEAVQVSAVRALGRETGAPVGRLLLERWSTLSPAARHEAGDVLLGDGERVWLLVDAIKGGTVQTWTLDFWQKRDLVMHRDPAVREASRALLEDDPRQRAETVRRYAAALDGAGDAGRGAEVFARACAMCHGIGGKGGIDLGPDLATVRHRPPLALLSDILLPSGSIAQSYETWLVERTNGDTEAGVLASQTPASITLRQGPASEVTILRSEIRRMTVSPQSSMPADLDKVITPAEMADLIAYLRQ
jgi:putative membrane-bound dehydrogenase-like protein